MAGHDTTLQNKNGEDEFPRTFERNVYDENGVNLKEKMKFIVKNTDEPYNFSHEMYNKQLNLFDKNNFASFGDYIGFDISNLKIGETYTFSTNLPIVWFKISIEAMGVTSVEINGYRNEITFEMTRNSAIPETSKQYLFIGINGNNIYDPVHDISELNDYEMQIEKGSVKNQFQPYQGGKFVQIGDIKPIVLWENGNSNIAFDSQNMIFSSDDYVRGICYCKRTNTENTLVSVEFLKGYGFLVSNAHTQGGVGADNYERQFIRVSDTEYSVGNCWNGANNSENQKNDNLVPLKILGFKY